MRLSRPRFLAQWMIRRFQKHYRIDMEEFQGQPEDYRSLADFFLRPLDPAKRPLTADEKFILSPADGRLSELEFVSEDRATQVKGKTYPLSRFLAEASIFPRAGTWPPSTCRPATTTATITRFPAASAALSTAAPACSRSTLFRRAGQKTLY